MIKTNLIGIEFCFVLLYLHSIFSHLIYGIYTAEDLLIDYFGQLIKLTCALVVPSKFAHNLNANNLLNTKKPDRKLAKKLSLLCAEHRASVAEMFFQNTW